MKVLPKIDLFIIGAQKAGTTSLKNYLGEHPDMMAHSSKEFSFFYDDKEFEGGFEAALNKFFPKADLTNKTLVCKHAHLYSSEKGIERLKEHNPGCQLIFIMRNPVTRTFSSYLMEKLYSRVNFEFDDIRMALDGSSQMTLEAWQYEAIVEFGLYAKYLKNVYKHFPKEQVTLLLFEDFKKNPLSYCSQLFSKFGLNSDFQPRVRVVHNKTAMPRSQLLAGVLKRFLVEKNPVKEGIKKLIPANTTTKLGERLRAVNRSEKTDFKMSEEIKSYLHSYFKPYNEELEQLTGLDLSSWEEEITERAS